VRKLTKTLSYLLACTPILAVCLRFITVGFPDGHDSIYGLVRVAEFKSSIMDGQFPPYWANNLYGGYGSPIFLFYGPLYLGVSTLWSVLTGSIASGMILATLSFALVAALGLKLLMSETVGNESFRQGAASRIAIYFFILTPYLIADIFLHNAFSEYAALCLVPTVLYSLVMIGRKPLLGSLTLAAAFAFTITAHNLTGLVCAGVITTGALTLYLPEKNFSLWSRIIGSMALGLGIAAFFWVPAIYYLPLVRTDQKMITGDFDFHNNFPLLRHIFGHDQFFLAGRLVPLVIIMGAGVIILPALNGNHRPEDYLFLPLASHYSIFFSKRALVYRFGKLFRIFRIFSSPGV